jgi:uncharacterized DUF497 family protein
MRTTYDPAKNADYGERRMVVVGPIGLRLHVAIVTARGDATHVIGFRKANKKEVKHYEQGKR